MIDFGLRDLQQIACAGKQKVSYPIISRWFYAKEGVMLIWTGLLAVLVAYLVGSIPFALLYSKLMRAVDIRDLGDGNMGARNSKRQFGWRAGVLIALADILKGMLAVQLVVLLGLPAFWQYLGGAFVVLGHDFPIFARFKGGQGFAATTGVFLRLFPGLTMIGFCIYVVIYFTTRSSDLAASLGMGFIAFMTWFRGESLYIVGFIVLMLLFIPIKKRLDSERTAALGAGAKHPL